MSDAIADAARLLLTEASPETVRAVLRLLVNDVLPAAPAPIRPPPALSARPGRKRAAGRTAPVAVDPAWEELRRQVRQAMRERGVTYEQLAATIGCAVGTAKVSLSRRLPASRPLQAGLRAWLEAPGEVAAPALPFRAGRGNGAPAQRGDSAVATRVHAPDAPASTA